MIDKWTRNIDEGEATDVIYCDFMKAFDRVPHNRLIEKLKSYGLEGDILRWIKDFLRKEAESADQW